MKQWNEFKSTLEKLYPSFSGALNDGASSKDLEAFEAFVGFTLPSELLDLYKLSNGQNEKVRAFFFGMEFLPLNRVQSSMESELELMEALAGEGDMCSSYPENHIKCAYVNTKWIPIFHGGSGAYIGIDLDPDTSGKVGQIINFGNDDEDKIVLADSLSEFIDLCTDKLSKGTDIKYSDDLKMYFYTDSYFVSALYEEIRSANA